LAAGRFYPALAELELWNPQSLKRYMTGTPWSWKTWTNVCKLDMQNFVCALFAKWLDHVAFVKEAMILQLARSI
jgi:hypothetical protein